MSLYIGLDVHKKFTVAVAVDETGKMLRQDKIVHGASIRRSGWSDYFNTLPEKPFAALEATGVSYPIYEAVEPFCRSVVMANPLKTKLIAEQRVKTDTIDGKTLAQLLRTDFLPTSYIPPREIRDQREFLRHRLSLVQVQTSLKNKIHAILSRCGEFPEASDIFGKKGRAYIEELGIGEPYKSEMARLFRLLDTVAVELVDLGKEIQARVELTPGANRLMSIPGIGKILAATIYWEIGEAKRFDRPGKLVGYCGLGARVHSSGGKTVHGSITKQGNKFLRWALVEAAQGWGKRGGPLGNFYRRIQFKHGSKSARVAVARKLAEIIWHMLVKGEDFDENRIGNRNKMRVFG